MNDKNIQINIETTADTAGAVKTEAALKKVGTSAKQIEAESRASASSI